jgi:hypothetical protein
MSVVESAREQLLSSGSWSVDPANGERLALALHGQLDRSDYGLVWNRTHETGGVLVGETVDLTLDVAAVRVD